MIIVEINHHVKNSKESPPSCLHHHIYTTPFFFEAAPCLILFLSGAVHDAKCVSLQIR